MMMVMMAGGDDNHVSKSHPLPLDQRWLVHAVLVPQGGERGLHTSSDMFSIKTSPVPTYLFLKINNQIQGWLFGKLLINSNGHLTQRSTGFFIHCSSKVWSKKTVYTLFHTDLFHTNIISYLITCSTQISHLSERLYLARPLAVSEQGLGGEEGGVQHVRCLHLEGDQIVVIKQSGIQVIRWSQSVIFR